MVDCRIAYATGDLCDGIALGRRKKQQIAVVQIVQRALPKHLAMRGNDAASGGNNRCQTAFHCFCHYSFVLPLQVYAFFGILQNTGSGLFGE